MTMEKLTFSTRTREEMLSVTDALRRAVEGNADAHVKASLFGSSVSLIVEDGRLLLGTWQAVWLFEGDGPRRRELWLKWLSA